MAERAAVVPDGTGTVNFARIAVNREVDATARTVDPIYR